MKIIRTDENLIEFDNGNRITVDHCQDCCEHNFADCDAIDDIARNYDFEENLEFRFINGYGFRFGDKRAMFSVPCYSEQNGYYSDDVDIYYNGIWKGSLDCPEPEGWY